MRRSSNVFNKDLELETIPEGSEIQLTLASPQRRINIEMNEKKNEDFLSEDDQPNLHAMSKMELLNVQRSAKEDKKQFRRWLKEKEAKFLEENGRKIRRKWKKNKNKKEEQGRIRDLSE